MIAWKTTSNSIFYQTTPQNVKSAAIYSVPGLMVKSHVINSVCETINARTILCIFPNFKGARQGKWSVMDGGYPHKPHSGSDPACLLETNIILVGKRCCHHDLSTYGTPKATLNSVEIGLLWIFRNVCEN